jgi:hypothetical protein
VKSSPFRQQRLAGVNFIVPGHTPRSHVDGIKGCGGKIFDIMTPAYGDTHSRSCPSAAGIRED